jgi:hypothetical protein
MALLNERKAAMDWKLAMEAERAALKRIVALLFALADLAERAACRSQAVRGFVLWILRSAEDVARNLVTGTPTPVPLYRAGDSPADARRLAEDFRNLARELADELHCQAALAYAVHDDCGGHNEPAGFGVRRTLRLGCALSFMIAPAFQTSREILYLAGLPDTS